MHPGALALLGLIAGLVSGLLGVGGGLVVGPALALAAIPLRRATGTALAMVAPVALIGMLTELWIEPGFIQWPLVGLITAGGLLGIQLSRGPAQKLSEHRLRVLFGLLLLAVAARQLGLGGGAPDGPVSGLLTTTPWIRACGAALLGVVAGGCAMLFGVGGGVVVVPGLVFLLGGVSPHAAAATSLAAMIPTASVGAWGAWRDGRVDLRLVRRILPLALVGGVCGVLLRDRGLEAVTLARLFGGFLVFVAFQLFRRRA